MSNPPAGQFSKPAVWKRNELRHRPAAALGPKRVRDQAGTPAYGGLWAADPRLTFDNYLNQPPFHTPVTQAAGTAALPFVRRPRRPCVDSLVGVKYKANMPDEIDEKFIDNVMQRERDAEACAARWKSRFKILAWATLFAPLVGWHWIQCLVAPSFITPSDIDTQTLYLHTRHWFGPNTTETLKSRRTDFGSVEWMLKSPNGEWTPAFEWR